MDFVIAIKAESVRNARVTAPRKVTILLTPSTEAADKTILHRDASYNSKLQGTCFSCSKLNANPPQSVCGIIDDPPPPSDCYDTTSNPCDCMSCPPPPDSRGCSCSGQTYATANTVGYGSGYWIGLQANTYYSNVTGGGWVVAVGCESGSIVGAFPVTGSNFGYGSGTIASISVMIYPAGAVYAAGLLPENSTSFPVLGLTTEEGNAIISAGSFGSIASGSTSPGCPTSSPQYFCTAENSTVYSGYPKTCLAKYPGNSETGCAEFDDFLEWPSTINYDTNSDGAPPYYINLGGVAGYTQATSFSGSISFSDGAGGSFCGGFDGNTVPSDPISGSCGANPFPYTPISTHSDCKECVDETVNVPCQFLVNLTNGPFDYSYGGYSSAGLSGYYGIGPAFPPNVEGGAIVNNEFWSTQWGWTNEEYYYPTYVEGEDNNPVIIPPISSLIDKCKCPNNQVPSQGVIFVESFPCNCDCSNPPPNGVGIIKVTAPGYSGCGAGCQSNCVSSKCSCNGFEQPGETPSESGQQHLGRVNNYAYVPCSSCDCTDPENPVDSGSDASELTGNSSIWWTKSGSDVGGSETIGLAAIDAKNSTDSVISGPCRNRCRDVFSLANPICLSRCREIVTQDENNNPVLNVQAFQDCTGYESIELFLNDECAKMYFLPAFLKDCTLTYQTTPVHENIPPYISELNFNYNIANYIKVEGEGCGCGDNPDGFSSLRDCLCGNLSPSECYLANISGPFGDAVQSGCSGIILGALFGCVIPTMETKTYSECNSPTCATIRKEGLSFKEIVNNCKKIPPEGGRPITVSSEEVLDPCGCCSQEINPTGGGSLNGNGSSVPSLECGGALGANSQCQADCCNGSGCVDSDCPLPFNVSGPSECDCFPETEGCN